MIGGQALEKQISSSKIVSFVNGVIVDNRFVVNRIQKLKDSGLIPFERACGTGGVNRFFTRNGVVYYQISHGWGMYNYGFVVEIGHIRADCFLENDFKPF